MASTPPPEDARIRASIFAAGRRPTVGTHYTVGQRAMYAAKVAQKPVGRNWGEDFNSANSRNYPTASQAAQMTGVGTRSVEEVLPVEGTIGTSGGASSGPGRLSWPALTAPPG